MRVIVFLLVGLSACQRANYSAIAPPWTPDYNIRRSENAVKAFEKQDSTQMPLPNGIVLAGSSSFTFWKSAAQDLAPLPIINRGFGGSTLPEVAHYTARTITKYRPKAIMVYCENDLFGDKAKTPEQVRDAYVALVRQVRHELPKSTFYFVSLKPSPSRWKRWDETSRANELIKAFVNSDKRHFYVDITQVMMKNGRPDPAIFRSDSLHMNDEGYRRWTGILKPILELEQP
jgi:lysophospholipase L1-like esterase